MYLTARGKSKFQKISCQIVGRFYFVQCWIAKICKFFATSRHVTGQYVRVLVVPHVTRSNKTKQKGKKKVSSEKEIDNVNFKPNSWLLTSIHSNRNHELQLIYPKGQWISLKKNQVHEEWNTLIRRIPSGCVYMCSSVRTSTITTTIISYRKKV